MYSGLAPRFELVLPVLGLLLIQLPFLVRALEHLVLLVERHLLVALLLDLLLLTCIIRRVPFVPFANSSLVPRKIPFLKLLQLLPLDQKSGALAILLAIYDEFVVRRIVPATSPLQVDLLLGLRVYLRLLV